MDDLSTQELAKLILFHAQALDNDESSIGMLNWKQKRIARLLAIAHAYHARVCAQSAQEAA